MAYLELVRMNMERMFMVSSNFNTKPGKSYRLEYSATFNYSDGRSETITGSASR